MKKNINPFTKAVGLLASGTIVAHLVTLLSAPLITRIFGPESYGALGLLISLLVVFTPISTMSLAEAIVVCEDNDVNALRNASVLAAIATALFLFAGGFFIASSGYSQLGWYLLLLPLAVLIYGLYQVVEQLSIRQGSFKKQAHAIGISSFFDAFLKIAIGYMSSTAFVLLASHSISKLSGLLYLKNFIVGVEDKDEKKSLKETLRKYRDFPVYRAPQAFLNGASQGLPIILLSQFFGLKSAGFFTLAKMTISVPSALLGKAISDVFYKKVVEVFRGGQNPSPFLLKVTFALAAIGIIPFSILIIWGDWIFLKVFGEEWIRAGVYAQILSFWFFLVFINAPSLKVIPLLRLQKFHLAFTVLTFLIRLIGIYICYRLTGNDLFAVSVFTFIACLGNIYLFIYVYSKLKISVYDPENPVY